MGWEQGVTNSVSSWLVLVPAASGTFSQEAGRSQPQYAQSSLRPLLNQNQGSKQGIQWSNEPHCAGLPKNPALMGIQPMLGAW